MMSRLQRQRKLLKSSTSTASYVPLMDAQVLPEKEKCAADMEQRSHYVDTMDAQIKLLKEECAVGMEERNYAATKDVQNTIREVECAEGMEQRTNYTARARNDVSLMSVREECVGVGDILVLCFKRHVCV